MTVKEYILEKVKKGTMHMVLLDPDKQTPEEAAKIALKFKEAGTDAVMIGGSTGITTENVDATAVAIKEATGLPTIYFPAGPHALSTKCDAIYFMSVVNSTDLNMVIGAHMKAGIYVKKIGIEPISMGYIIVEPGMTVGRVAKANLIKRDDVESAVAHAVGCELLGMNLVYLEAGSGADKQVPPEMIAAVKKYVTVPVIVGGGIRDPESAAIARKGGADIIVTGTFAEKCSDDDMIRKVVAAAKGI